MRRQNRPQPLEGLVKAGHSLPLSGVGRDPPFGSNLHRQRFFRLLFRFLFLLVAFKLIPRCNEIDDGRWLMMEMHRIAVKRLRGWGWWGRRLGGWRHGQSRAEGRRLTILAVVVVVIVGVFLIRISSEFFVVDPRLLLLREKVVHRESAVDLRLNGVSLKKLRWVWKRNRRRSVGRSIWARASKRFSFLPPDLWPFSTHSTSVWPPPVESPVGRSVGLPWVDNYGAAVQTMRGRWDFDCRLPTEAPSSSTRCPFLEGMRKIYFGVPRDWLTDWLMERELELQTWSTTRQTSTHNKDLD